VTEAPFRIIALPDLGGRTGPGVRAVGAMSSACSLALYAGFCEGRPGAAVQRQRAHCVLISRSSAILVGTRNLLGEKLLHCLRASRDTKVRPAMLRVRRSITAKVANFTPR
jgi:hypothetical protein